MVIVTSTLNITKGLGIKSMKELQPSVSASCCRRDRHVNNQVDIKSKATMNYLQRYIYYKGNAHRPVHGPCLYMLGYSEGR